MGFFDGVKIPKKYPDVLDSLIQKESNLNYKTDLYIEQIAVLVKDFFINRRLSVKSGEIPFESLDTTWRLALEYYKELLVSKDRKGRDEVVGTIKKTSEEVEKPFQPNRFNEEK